MIILRQRLYSTGDEYLDELLEKAFCEGYEYAQKEFGIRQKFEDFVFREMEKDAKKFEDYKANSKPITETVSNFAKRTKKKASEFAEGARGKLGSVFSRGKKRLALVRI